MRATAVLRFILKRSVMYAVTTSINDMTDVMAAISKMTKNNTANTLPSGICAKILGSTINTSPGPSCGDIPNANTAGMMANPANTANNVSEMPVKKANLFKFSSFGMYDPYVIRQPMPRLKEKNACPNAANTAFVVILEKSGLNKTAARPQSLPR